MNNRSAYGALQPTFDPEPDPRAMVFGLQARFTLLTSRLICIDAEHNSPVAYNPDAETLTLALELEPADAHLLHINRG